MLHWFLSSQILRTGKVLHTADAAALTNYDPVLIEALLVGAGIFILRTSLETLEKDDITCPLLELVGLVKSEKIDRQPETTKPKRRSLMIK
jgi:hypothetical protein